MLTILTIIIFLLTKFLHWRIPWYYFILIYISAILIGSFLYTYFAGVNCKSVRFIGGNNINHQYFLVKFQLGFSPIYPLTGYFDNSTGLKEEELAQLIYEFATKRMLYRALKFGTKEPLSLPYKKSNIILYLG